VSGGETLLRPTGPGKGRRFTPAYIHIYVHMCTHTYTYARRYVLHVHTYHTYIHLHLCAQTQAQGAAPAARRREGCSGGSSTARPRRGCPRTDRFGASGGGGARPLSTPSFRLTFFLRVFPPTSPAAKPSPGPPRGLRGRARSGGRRPQPLPLPRA